MHKSPFVLGLLIILTLLAGAFLLYQNKTPQEEASEETIANITDTKVIEKPLEETPILKDEERKESDKKEKYRISAIYPSVILATSPSSATQASDVIKGFVNREVDEFLKNMREMNEGTEGVPEEFESDFTLRYKPELLSPSMIALRFEMSSYVRGAAHPMSNTKILLYDLSLHELLDTSDLFTPGLDYLGYLSQISRSKLRALLPDTSQQEFDLEVIPGTEAKSENFHVVVPSPDGLHIIFNPYQVAPYARGTVEITIPLTEIGDQLSTSTKAAIHSSASLPASTIDQ